VQDADAWMHEHGVIHTLLKANLHQRQYADLVCVRVYVRACARTCIILIIIII
jgi:hypothetical protein